MPAYSLTGPAIEHLAADPLFDPRTTPSRMGAISEGFRLSPGTIRSIHPSHSMAVRGRGAEEIVAGHRAAPTPFGELARRSRASSSVTRFSFSSAVAPGR